MPATYMLPEEQSHINDSSTPFSRPEENGQGHEREALQGGVDGYNEDGEMGEVRNRGRFGVGTGMEERRNPPAKYDSLGYSTVGLGLYDDAREAYYTGYGGEASNALHYPQGVLRASQAPTPVYTPGLYKAYNSPGDSQQDQMTTSNSEPSFNAVPKYSPLRIQNPSILSGETVVGSTEGGRSEGTYMGRIVEEPEETSYTAARQPALVQRSGNVQCSMAFAGHSQGAGVPVPATPSLVNAIKRVSEAQAQARAWQISEQQRQQQGLPGPTHVYPTDHGSNHTASPTLPSSGSSATTLGIAGKRLPESEMTALRQAAVRRQASAEWWSEVERKANEAANKERNAIMTPRSSSAPWKNSSTGPERY